jgi:hypothetical protein
MAKIYLKFNGAVIKEYKLAKDETTFGRKPNNDIVIGHPTISGFHGKIRKDGDRFIVEDLNSTNGTFLNGQRIKAAALHDRDKVGAAGHILEFVVDDAATATPQPQGRVGGLDGPAGDAEAGPANPLAAAEAAAIEKQKELLRRSLGLEGEVLPAPAPIQIEPVAAEVDTKGVTKSDHGVVRIISGGVEGQTEVILKELVTYIGASDQAIIKIKGFLAPSLAAAISRRPEGYFLKAVKAGYPKVNGNVVNEQVFLENGALIEVGGTNMVFYFADKRKKPA